MANNGATFPTGTDAYAEEKGKGKALADQVHEDAAMDEDDEEEEEEDDDEEPQADEDGMEEIDVNNIVAGRRTRGQVIDFAKAAEQHPADDDEDDDDDDFHPAEEEQEQHQEEDTKMSD